MKRPVVALALGGGTARGLAHIGVLKVLVENKVPISFVTGTSIGAIIGSLFASGMSVEDLETLALHTNNRRILKLLDPSFSSGLIKGNKVESFLRNHLDGKKFKDLILPLVVVSTDINTGEPFYFDKGDVVKAVRASISIPLVFSPVVYKNKILVDGHLSEPVPVVAASSKGADIIIAVNLDSDKKMKENLQPSFRSVASRTTQILLYQLSKSNSDKADVVISPGIDYSRFADFSDAKKLIKKGEMAAEAALPEIWKVLNSFKS